MRARPVALGVAIGIGLAAACGGDFVRTSPCTAIPDGGCPEAIDTCRDVSCEAVYRCERLSNTWAFVASCGPRPPEDGGGEAPRDAGSDAEGPCPLLQLPDCERSLPACEAGCCGCEDLFSCEDGEWRFVEVCDGGATSSAFVGASGSRAGEQR